ncbi:cell division protein FtsA [Evansella caseinilytica]|uniref:Cell division protein FtsA n=1 Tax=Evansella caseinilytica TaxID=1503961 RepID=A0A1H3RT28_9BACI|nr:pilus assembly protein PilM [Evansella caseinilytica]SDZ28760.1 cell division protein FtsA [Evansella caseinilytica]
MNAENSKPLFALDIGTRSVVGLILYKKETHYHVVDIVRMEHKERSMLDGQIHNVLQVSNVITQIKTQLETKHGPLKSVCVAAAGRSLKTKRAAAEIDIKGKPTLDQQMILHMELTAVQKAQFSLAKENGEAQKKANDFCVGYSVIDYRLDNEVIGSLVDQKGEKASVEVIATFLPKIVVESLISALQRSGLELEALTLEPIAAINVLIPPSMRRLNVALVDVGAGTSDIAITNLGTVVAYGMVPVAGDEITEAISDHYLLDFPEAEQLKRELATQDKVCITDILGFETEYNKSEVVASIHDAILNLAKSISDEIIALNQQPPKAVMLVGGGSMTPMLPEKVAEYLQLPTNRVAIRGIDALKGVTFEKDVESTPELVTPIGIAIAARESPVEYISITVNERLVRLFDIKQLTVGDGLLSSGLEFSKIYGKPGMGLMVKVNNQVVSLPGEHGTPPMVKKNGQVAALDEPIQHGDVIEIIKGEDGKDASAVIGDFCKDVTSIPITFNSKKVDITPVITRNQQPATLKTPVMDRDQLTIALPATVGEIINQLVPEFTGKKKQFTIFIDGDEYPVNTSQEQLLLNDQPVTLIHPVKPGDRLHYTLPETETVTVGEIFQSNHWETVKTIQVTFNGEKVMLEKPLIDVYRGEEKLAFDAVLSHGNQLRTVEKKDKTFIFQDVFTKVSIKKPTEKARKPVILRNDKETSFAEQIHHGDVLELKWI